MKRRHSSRAAWMFAGALLATAFVGSMAVADSFDPSMPVVVVVGSPRGSATGARVDAARTGRSATHLPFPPTEIWRAHVQGGIEFAPVVDDVGNVFVVEAAPEVMKLSRNGKELWRTRIGIGMAASPPVLTSNGNLVLLTTAGDAWAIRPNGVRAFTTPLGVRGRLSDTEPLARDDGSIVFAVHHQLLVVDADGVVRSRASLDEPLVGAVLPGREGVLVTTESGVVHSWNPPGAPRRIGAFGGIPYRGAVLADQRTLVAVVDGRRIEALDLKTGLGHVRMTAQPTTGSFDAPPAVSRGIAMTTTSGGLLVGVDPAGNERPTTAIEKQSPPAAVDGGAPAGGFFGTFDDKPSAPVVLDDEGRVAAARSGGRVVVVGPQGNLAVAGERMCSTPVALQPAGDRRLLVACRDGTLWMLGE